jgi:hypothetical protein
MVAVLIGLPPSRDGRSRSPARGVPECMFRCEE